MQESIENKVNDLTKSLENEIKDYLFYAGTNEDDIKSWAFNLATTIHKVTDKPKLVHTLEAIFSEAKNAENELTNNRILLLKNQIIAIQSLSTHDIDNFSSSEEDESSFSKEPYHNWKDAIYGIKQIPLMSSSFTQTFFNPNAKKTIDLTPKRFAFTSPKCQDYMTIVGSTFTTNDKKRLALETANIANGSGSHILDASYTAAIEDGFVIAIADGLGGHMNDSKQDETIGQTSKTVAKEAARFMAAAYDPEASFKFIKKMINEEVAIKTPKKHEGAAISCGRAIRTEDGCQFTGFSVGDTMLIAYEPKTNEFIQVVPARQLKQNLSGGPAYLPNKSSNSMDVLFFDCQLSADAIVFGLSDGVYDHLPTKERHLHTSGKALSEDHDEYSYYSDTYIDFKALHNHLDDQIQNLTEVTASILTGLIADMAIKIAEDDRSQRMSESKEGKKRLEALKEYEVILKSKEESFFKDRDAGDHSEADLKERQEQIKAEVAEFSRQQHLAYDKAKVKMGDDFTIVGLQLSATDFSYNLVKDKKIADLKFVDAAYSTKEIFASIVTLGLYAIIRDSLGYQHQAYSNKQNLLCTLGILAFLFTGSVFGLCYLSFKLGCAVSEVIANASAESKKNPELLEQVDGHQDSENIEMNADEEFSMSSSSSSALL